MAIEKLYKNPRAIEKMYKSFSETFGCTDLTFEEFRGCLRLWHNPSTNDSPCVEGKASDLYSFFQTEEGKKIAAQIFMNPKWVTLGDDEYEVTFYVASPLNGYNNGGKQEKTGDGASTKTMKVFARVNYFGYLKTGKDIMGMMTRTGNGSTRDRQRLWG